MTHTYCYFGTRARIAYHVSATLNYETKVELERSPELVHSSRRELKAIYNHSTIFLKAKSRIRNVIFKTPVDTHTGRNIPVRIYFRIYII